MPDWAWIAAIVALYIMLTRWLLPKLGMPT